MHWSLDSIIETPSSTTMMKRGTHILCVIGSLLSRSEAFSMLTTHRYSPRQFDICNTQTLQSTCLKGTSVFFEEEETSNVLQDIWEGASGPRPDLDPKEIPSLLMDALRFNDIPSKDAGLSSVWKFTGDTTRHIFQHNITEFIESAHETADTMVTSFYGAAMSGKEWRVEQPLNRVGGEDGWIATQVVKTVCSDGRVRRWQWELRKHRRPPNMGSWYVDSIGSSDRQGNFEPE